jgi:hypothetical protein
LIDPPAAADNAVVTKPFQFSMRQVFFLVTVSCWIAFLTVAIQSGDIEWWQLRTALVFSAVAALVSRNVTCGVAVGIVLSVMISMMPKVY